MSFSTRVRTCASLFFCAFAFGFGSAAQAESTHYTVGLQPLSIIANGNIVHVFHNEVDADFDAVQDEGDQPASWWVLDASTGEVLDKKDFDWGGVGYPFRPFVDIENGVVYITNLGRVRSFSLSTRELLRDTVALYNASGIAVHGDVVYISIRPSFSDPGMLVTYNTSTGVATERTVGVNPQQITPFKTSDGAEGVLVLSEGVFGGGTPAMLDKEFFDGRPAPAGLELGATGNHIFVQGDTAFVTINGSDVVRIVDLKQWAVVGSISVVTEPGNGPRESVVQGDDLFVSTFDGDVRWYSVSTGVLKQTFDPGGKPEGIALIGSFIGKKIWVTNAYQKTGFGSDNSIAVWDLSVTSVSENISLAKASIVPSVVTDEAELVIPATEASGNLSCTIITITGQETGRFRLAQNAGQALHVRLSAAKLGLSSGRYFLQVYRDGNATVIPFAVVR